MIDYINTVFDYYNGRINKFNYPCRVVINDSYRYGSTITGCCRTPNIIEIYPISALRFVNNNVTEAKLLILETIIHELYHCDQIIDYNRYRHNKIYSVNIESACELKTNMYMINNIDEILMFIGDYSMKHYLLYRYHKAYDMWSNIDGEYIKRSNLDHIIMCFKDRLNINSIEENIIHCIDKRKSLYVNDFAIILNGEIINIQDFNTWFSMFYSTSIVDLNKYSYSTINGDVYYTIQFRVMERMCMIK